MLFSFTVTGALSGRYNPTLTAITLTANSAWIGRTGCFLVSVSESKQELLGVLLCLLYYPTLFDLAFLALLKEPFNFLNNYISHAVPGVISSNVNCGALAQVRARTIRLARLA